MYVYTYTYKTAYPAPGMPFWNTYGPGLSSASKLYSFGYLESISLDGEGTGSFSMLESDNGDGGGGGEGATVPLQGTALFVVGLKAEGQEDAETRCGRPASCAVYI